ncbi:LysR substrate-binding domain-containing protein [Pseudomonas sp. ZM23]|uniref:LysR substrate-binding domain-containing protein n=1 Tax=Pseudomonas triclosanedens TaxID=2961893 RepID=A0ABY7A7G8_9PSED|nr:LysR substrate-binding domain-containing protein [Pseudomonas triclosanedens]MCP8466339.1 LysR substrate-binding domain-containing protein [Pseudomonas triclosanedens]MCP8471865.1 LysR substrate-binding domain-containing protein [Pseudomonas triclosanedens]MCP8478560.1 LysR substrate-binding domain-containing protein [Pseudomonas triclosanedens]WAI52245.1 LysR substrate-binding domain-containing protein [Pseudomonas triclosanedens]
MDLSSLEIFRCVAEEQSVTRAAARLQRVQSNVTTRIRQLEDDLGAPLFLRDGKRMTLTDQGRDFLAYAERLLALAAEARQSLHPDTASGPLRLGSMESTAASRLPIPLARFHRDFPEVELRVSTGHSQKLLGEVLDRQLDCALIAHPDILRAEPGFEATLERGLCAEPVFREELLLVLPANHPPVARPEDVRIRTLAGFARGCTYRLLAERWLAGAPLAVQEVGSYHGILACVNAGSCIGVLPRSVLELQRDMPGLQVVPMLEVDTLLIWREGYATGAFRRWREILAARP